MLKSEFIINIIESAYNAGLRSTPDKINVRSSINPVLYVILSLYFIPYSIVQASFLMHETLKLILDQKL